MERRHLVGGVRKLGMILLIVTAAGCASLNQTDQNEAQAVHVDQVIADLTPHIEKLYLSWHDLNQVYKDVKFLERGFLFDADDQQLGYIQKASLYVQDALLRIHHQWEQLSVLHYIRPEMMRDYLTLSAAGLTSAIKEIAYDRQFLTIYGSFIAHEAVTQDLNQARHLIDKNYEILNQILERLLRIANVTSPPTTL